MPSLLLLAIALTAAPEFDVQPLEGAHVSGRLAALDARHVTIELPSGPVTMETEKVASITVKGPSAGAASPHVWVQLTDGSLLAADQYTAHGGTARIALSGGEGLDLPTREVATVRFQEGAEAGAAEWSRIAGLKLQSDVLVTAVGDSIDYHKGTLQEVTEGQVTFNVDGEPLAVKRAKIYGLIYYHAADDEASEAPISVVDTGGSRWSAKTIQLDGKLQWTAAGGRTVRRDLDRIAVIDLSRGKIVYLSDLKADVARYTPFFGLDKELPSRLEFFRPRRDQNFESKPLRIAGTTYPKGLALHSRTEMVYALGGRFSRLEAVAGIDDAVRPRGHVRLVVRGDDKVLLETTVAGSDVPQPISLSVSGAGRLMILVDYGDDLDVSDHLDLGNARLLK
jgi:hypothetical protein